ncbi:MAG: hypothetical protein P9M14_01360 [Candidatus Alcyoniella australis]|nr:hypothetical protein [Candidatus Alcyoniella australis]
MSEALRVVLDYDLLAADVLWPKGRAPGILPLALDGRIHATFDPQMLKSYTTLLCDSELGLDPDDVVELIDSLTRNGCCVRTRRPSSVPGLSDPDRRLLACAVAGRADALISMRPERFGHSRVRNVSIVDPSRFNALFISRISLPPQEGADTIGPTIEVGECP